jgi:hypothetical protein
LPIKEFACGDLANAQSSARKLRICMALEHGAMRSINCANPYDYSEKDILPFYFLATTGIVPYEPE